MKRVRVYIERSDNGQYTATPDSDLQHSISGKGNTREEAINDLKVAYQCLTDYFDSEGTAYPTIEFDFVDKNI